VPTCPIEICAGGEIWVKPVFGYANPAEHWRQRLEDGLAHNLNLVIAKAVLGQLTACQSPSEVIRQAALFGTRNRDGWDTGLTILTALGQLLPFLAKEETHLALLHGARRVAADCDGAAPSRERAPLASRPDLTTLKRWLRRWVAVRHRDAAERTVLTAIVGDASPAALADLLFAAETDRAYADGGHSLDFINKAFECIDVIGWEHAADVLPSVVGQMAAGSVRCGGTRWYLRPDRRVDDAGMDRVDVDPRRRSRRIPWLPPLRIGARLLCPRNNRTDPRRPVTDDIMMMDPRQPAASQCCVLH
jgi:hypothetical protein